jgi:hypothetical protein
MALVKDLLKEYPEIEIGSIDGIQGREKYAVILTFVWIQRVWNRRFPQREQAVNWYHMTHILVLTPSGDDSSKNVSSSNC